MLKIEGIERIMTKLFKLNKKFFKITLRNDSNVLKKVKKVNEC